MTSSKRSSSSSTPTGSWSRRRAEGRAAAAGAADRTHGPPGEGGRLRSAAGRYELFFCSFTGTRGARGSSSALPPSLPPCGSHTPGGGARRRCLSLPPPSSGVRPSRRMDTHASDCCFFLAAAAAPLSALYAFPFLRKAGMHSARPGASGPCDSTPASDPPSLPPSLRPPTRRTRRAGGGRPRATSSTARAGRHRERTQDALEVGHAHDLHARQPPLPPAGLVLQVVR